MQQRLEMPGTAYGRRDVLLDAIPLVQEADQILESESTSFQEMLSSLREAAEILDDEAWHIFCDLPSRQVHMEDAEMLLSFIGRVDPSWGAMLTKAKRRERFHQCIHVGATAPTADLKISLHDFNFELIEEDPAEGEYPLVFANLSADLPMELNPEETEKSNALPHDNGAGVKPIDGGGYVMPQLSDLARSYAPGFLGTSQDEGVEKHLQIFRYILIAAIQRLAPGATMIVTWPGMPDHPVLFFLTSHLRRKFSNVYVLTQPEPTTFEVFVIATGFVELCERVENWFDWGKTFEYFLTHKAHRTDGYDDVLLWTLTRPALLKEVLELPCRKTSIRARAGKKDNAELTAGSYEDLWKAFAAKYKALAHALSCGQIPSRGCRTRSSGYHVGNSLQQSGALGSLKNAGLLRPESTAADIAQASALATLVSRNSMDYDSESKENLVQTGPERKSESKGYPNDTSVLDTRKLMLGDWHADVYKAQVWSQSQKPASRGQRKSTPTPPLVSSTSGTSLQSRGVPRRPSSAQVRHSSTSGTLVHSQGMARRPSSAQVRQVGRRSASYIFSHRCWWSPPPLPNQN